MTAMGWLAQAAIDGTRLSVGGVIVMSASIAMVLGLSAFCIVRILAEKKPSDHHHAPLDIDTKDLDM